MDLSTPAEQRAFAVAKIRLATSLPRTKDGRRPSMHVEAVSEGDRSQLDLQVPSADGHLSDDSPMMSEGQCPEDTRETELDPELEQGPGHELDAGPGPKPQPEVETEHSEAKADDPKTEEEPIFSPPATPLLPEDAPTKSRRRSRSRSRGRGSKDFKGKAKATQSPVPTNAVPSANKSPPDEGPVSSTQPTGLTSPPFISPIPAHFALLQARLLASPEPGMFYPRTSPPTPMHPTLQDIQRQALQRGLFRSNSAAARLMALQQLAGPEAYDPLIASPPVTPPPLPGRVFRNNTVGGSGGERIAARKMMTMRHINRHVKEAEAEQTSGGEDPQPVPHTRRKRPRRRSSTNRSMVVDDREPPSAASPTPPVFPTAYLPRSTPDPTRDESDRLVPPSHAPNPRSPSVERSREDALAKLTGESPSSATYDYETPLERRGVVVEEDDDAADHDHGQASPIPRSTYNGRSDTPPRLASPCPPHALGTPSSTSLESADAGVPAYLSDSTQELQEVFPTSPFTTPLREKQGHEEEEEEEEEYSYTESYPARRSPWSDSDISWVADLVPERIPLRDDDDDYDDDDDDDSLPRASIHSKNIVVDIESSPEAPKPLQIPPSPSSAIALSNDSGKRPRNDSIQERGNNANPGTLRSNGTVHLRGNAGRLKIYHRLFSFLADKINSMKTLDPRLESLLPRLHTHFEKFVDYGIIVSISESQQFRETLLEASLIFGKDCYTTAFDIAGEEICALFQEVLLNSEYKSTVRSLREEQAKGFMQELQEALRRGSPLLQEARLQRTAQRIVIDLSKACGDVPNELYVTEMIKEVSLDPIYMGGFGRIHRGLCSGRLVALKRLFKLENVTLVQRFCREAMIWKNLCGHPHILTFLGVDIESFPGEMCMVSEWMSNGTIIDFLKREPHHGVEKYLLQIAEGIQHLHSQGMYHGDLKGANILVSSDRKAKIADFGFANFADMSVSYATVRMGTPKWMAPELLDTRLKFQRTTESDIFAFACIAFEIYAGTPIFPDDDNVCACRRILAGDRPGRPMDGVPMPNRMWDLIEWCWLQDPSSRPQMEDVVKTMRELQEVDGHQEISELMI